MEFHPKNLPISKVYNITSEKEATAAVADMVKLGFQTIKQGYKVLMPKESKTAKRIGYTITTGITAGLRNIEDRNVKYWTYHHDDEHFAIVLIHQSVFEELGF